MDGAVALDPGDHDLSTGRDLAVAISLEFLELLLFLGDRGIPLSRATATRPRQRFIIGPRYSLEVFSAETCPPHRGDPRRLNASRIAVLLGEPILKSVVNADAHSNG